MKALKFSTAATALCLIGIACSKSLTEDGKVAATISRDSLQALRSQMRTVEDSIGNLLGQFENSSSVLQRADSARTTLEVQAARIAQVNEKLSINAPDVFKRLSTFVEQHKQMVARIAALDDTIATLRDRIRTLESRNSALRTQVSALRDENSAIKSALNRLLADSATRSLRIAQLDSTRNEILQRTSRAYVAIASKDSLSRLGMAGKTNFLRLGATVLKKFDRQVFRLVDTRRDTVFAIRVPERELELLSAHPPGSYVLVEENGATELRIIDVEAFWSISRTLTVMTKR